MFVGDAAGGAAFSAWAVSAGLAAGISGAVLAMAALAPARVRSSLNEPLLDG